MIGQTVYKHISRTYYDVYNALTNAYKNKPVWLFNELAGMFEFMGELMNRIAQDILYPTTRESAYSFAERNDYSPIEADGCTATETITLTGAMVKTLLAGYQIGGVSPSTNRMVIFELTANASSGGTDTITANVKQKKIETDVIIGTVQLSDAWQEFPIDGYENIISNSISLDIDGDPWIRVDNFDDSISTDKHFVLFFQSSGKARILFGNGTTGAIPGLNDAITATFETTQGLLGRLDATEIDTNIGGDGDIASLTNASATSGGNDSESIASIIRNSRANVRARDVIWSEEDAELAARQASGSVIKVLVLPGIGTAILHIIPTGGGAPAAGLKTIVKDYVEALTQFGIMIVTVSDPTYDAKAITADITVISGYVANTVRDLTEFAMTLVSTAIDSEVIEYFDDNGIDETRINVINTIWAWAFISDENDALEHIINQWKTLLGGREYREWDQPLEVGDLWIMGNSMYDYGVDLFTLTSPTVNQVPASNVIIDNASSTVTVV